MISRLFVAIPNDGFCQKPNVRREPATGWLSALCRPVDYVDLTLCARYKLCAGAENMKGTVYIIRNPLSVGRRCRGDTHRIVIGGITISCAVSPEIYDRSCLSRQLPSSGNYVEHVVTSIAENPDYARLQYHAAQNSPHNRAIYIIGHSCLSQVARFNRLRRSASSNIGRQLPTRRRHSTSATADAQRSP